MINLTKNNKDYKRQRQRTFLYENLYLANKFYESQFLKLRHSTEKNETLKND